MSQHTPGPWKVCEDGVNVYQPELDVAITNQEHPCAPDPDEAEANARLIAAAPDLLAALRQAVEAMKYAYLRLPVAQRDIIGPSNQLAEAAIRKAEGQS